MKGGHAFSGPPPDPNALRRDKPSDAVEWVRLPAKREGEVPDWPLSTMTPRERTRWMAEWSKPQAVMWEAAGQFEQVACYVRHFCEAERRNAPTPIRVLVKQEEEILGLSLTGLARNRWIVGHPPVAEEQRPTGTESPSAKQRFRTIDGGR